MPAAAPPIVFDATVLAAGPPTGVARAFATTLAAYVAAHGRTTRCVVLVAAPPPPDLLPDGVELRPWRPGPVARHVQLPRFLREERALLLHSAVAAIPSQAPCPMLATVHDLPWRSKARAALRSEAGCGLRHRVALQLAARRATRVLVPTAATATDLRAAAPRARIVVAPHGTQPAAGGPAPPEPRPGPLLVLGDDRPRKNLARVRAAHAAARAQCPSLPELRMVGPGFGTVTEAQKSALLLRCRAVVHLSLHEGFGLPVVEGMAHGAPVVCSDIPSLREVAGAAALLASPTDDQAMASALVAVHRDLPLRRRLHEAGRARAARFTPEAAAAAWRAVHDEVVTLAPELEGRGG